MQQRLFVRILYILVGLLLSPYVSAAFSASAADDCSDCISRKQKTCSEECDSVEPERARICQKSCITGYCKHRCTATSPEILALTEETCDACAERQFRLCEHHCATGTPRARAMCQLLCSDDRCAPICKAPVPAHLRKPKPTPTPKKKDDDDDDDDEDESGEEELDVSE